MSPMRRSAPVLAGVLALAACSFADSTLLPVLSGETTPSAAPSSAVAPPNAAAAAAAPSATGSPAGSAAAAKPAAGVVGELQVEVDRLRGDLDRHRKELAELNGSLDAASSAFQARASAIETRLTSPTGAGDPQLFNEWADAEDRVNRAGAQVARLVNLSSWATADVSLASYLQQAIHAAAGQPGMTAADRRKLATMAEQVDEFAGTSAQLVAQASGGLASRNLFLAEAHRKLALLGPQLGTGKPVSADSQPAIATASRRALVTIRFDQPVVAYRQQLYDTLTAALKRRPDLSLDVVAVAPPGHEKAGSGAATRNLQDVVAALTQMGIPDDRIRLSAQTLADASGDEIRIYPR